LKFSALFRSEMIPAGMIESGGRLLRSRPRPSSRPRNAHYFRGNEDDDEDDLLTPIYFQSHSIPAKSARVACGAPAKTPMLFV